MQAIPENADIIIVGGGSAGCVLAARLSENSDLKVLLLEAGGSNNHPYLRIPAASGMALSHPDFNWGYETEPDPSCADRPGIWHAGRRLGGGGAVNGMMFIRGHQADYDHWAALGNPGWSYLDLLPCFKRMETNSRGQNKVRGGEGPLQIADLALDNVLIDAWVRAATEAGYERNADLNSGWADGVDFCQVNQRRGRRHSAADAYLEPAKARSNLTVIERALVQRVTFKAGRASGVEVSLRGEQRSISATRGVVVSAGSLASPKLLSLSGIGPAQQLQELAIPVQVDAPEVGRNLQEHAGATIKYRVNAKTLGTDRGWLRNLTHGFNYLIRGRGPLTTPVGHAHAFVRSDSKLALPNLQLIMSAFSFDLTEKGAKLSGEPIIITAVGLCRPRSRGTVSLRSSDPQQPPLIEHHLLGHDEDVADLIAGLGITRNIFTQPALQPLVVDEEVPGHAVASDADLCRFVRESAFPMYHPSGTCRMGADKSAVVNPQLCVNGVSSLWVADASIMPTLPSGNTNATAMVIGERASELISQQIAATNGSVG